MTDHPRTPDQQAARATSVTPEEGVRTIEVNRVSWGAVLAGVVVALVVQLLLNMLGLSLGVATLDPGTGDNPSARTFSVAEGIWYVVAGIIAAYAGGHVAGRLSGRPLEAPAKRSLLRDDRHAGLVGWQIWPADRHYYSVPRRGL